MQSNYFTYVCTRQLFHFLYLGHLFSFMHTYNTHLSILTTKQRHCFLLYSLKPLFRRGSDYCLINAHNTLLQNLALSFTTTDHISLGCRCTGLASRLAERALTDKYLASVTQRSFDLAVQLDHISSSAGDRLSLQHHSAKGNFTIIYHNLLTIFSPISY